MVLVLVVWVGLTGMLHLDGFMDACDGLLPPRDPARRLEIMKDSRVGAMGLVTVACLLLVKTAALGHLDQSRFLALAIVLVPGQQGTAPGVPVISDALPAPGPRGT